MGVGWRIHLQQACWPAAQTLGFLFDLVGLNNDQATGSQQKDQVCDRTGFEQVADLVEELVSDFFLPKTWPETWFSAGSEQDEVTGFGPNNTAAAASPDAMDNTFNFC